MKISILVWGLLCAVAFPCYAQNWTPQDSLRLNRLLKGEGEVKLNPEVLQELEMNNSLGTPKAVMDKSWMDFDNSLPVMPKAPEKKWCLPYVLIQPIPNIIGTPFIRKNQGRQGYLARR